MLHYTRGATNPLPVSVAMSSRPLPRLFTLCLAALAGLALPFSFAPYEWWPLAPLSLAVLYFLIQAQTPRLAWFTGWVFGLGYFGFGVHWIYFSLHLFGAAIAPVAVLLTIAFVLVMTLFPALTAWAWVGLRRDDHVQRNALLFASLWVAAELLRGKLMGGFPWILIGYSQTATPLGAWAPLIGVYGIGFLLAWLSAALVIVVVGPRRIARGLALAVLLVIPVGSVLLDQLEWSVPRGHALRLRLVQANIPQEMKFSRERLENSLGLYTSLTLDSLQDIDLVVWPETAIPTYFDQVEQTLQPFVAQLEAAEIDVLSGVFTRDGNSVYNSVRQLGGNQALYRKRHLVPFGEFMPMRFLLDFAAQFIDIPMSDLAAGAGPHEPLQLQGESIGVSICYEDVYGEEMRALLPASTLLVNVSNDAWFGDNLAPYQHEQKARMRAREFSRPLIRVTNTGVSSAIDERGRVLGRIAHNTRGVLDVSVMPRTGMTIYARTGNWPVFILSLLVILTLWRSRRTK